MHFVATTAIRLDAFLAEQAEGYSRARVQTAIENGCVSVNEHCVKKSSYKLQEGDEVVFNPMEQSSEEILLEPFDLQLQVLYEDDDCFVVYKPAGIAVHPGTGMSPDEKTLLHGARFIAAHAELAHRLDKDTTGCLLFAKNDMAHTLLQQQFEKRTVEKQYLAIVAGVPDPPEAMIDAPIGRNVTERTKMSVLQTRASRDARTTYTTLQSSNASSLLLCNLHTGRTHQIRVHLHSIGHPLVGDTTYTNNASTDLAHSMSIDTICLHAWQLSFTSPTTQNRVHVCADIPPHFAQAASALGFTVENLQCR